MRWLDLHTHTRFSPDSGAAPADLVEAARRARLDGVAVTDHGTLRGGLAAREAAGAGLEVIVGAEYATDVGHVLGLFLEREIALGQAPVWPWREVLAAIREQGGLAILAHPTKTFRPLRDEVVAAMDGVEVYNARAECSRFPRANARAREAWLRGPDGLVATAGSDAHFTAEVGHARCAVAPAGDLRRALAAGVLAIEGRGTPPIYEAASQALKTARQRNWPAAPRSAARLAWGALRTVPRLAVPPAPTRWEGSRR